MDDYPIKERIKQKALAKDKTIVAIAAEIEKTDRWIHTIKSINDLTLEMITRLSLACDFDFLKDYSDWRIAHNQSALNLWSEPKVDYEKAQKNISVNISVKGPIYRFNEGFGDVLNELKKISEKHGFEIE